MPPISAAAAAAAATTAATAATGRAATTAATADSIQQSHPSRQKRRSKTKNRKQYITADRTDDYSSGPPASSSLTVRLCKDNGWMSVIAFTLQHVCEG